MMPDSGSQQSTNALQLTFELLDSAHRVRIALNQGTRDTVGLTIEQALTLCRISMAEEPLPLSELAATLDRSDNATTTLLKNLEARGLVVRQRDVRGDKRVVRPVLTPAGQNAVSRFRALVPSLMQKLHEHGGSNPLVTLMETAATLRALQSAGSSPAPGGPLSAGAPS